MSTITIDRPSNRNLEALFDLHLFVQPGLNGVPSMDRKRIEIGQPSVSFVSTSLLLTNGALLIWPSKAEWIYYDGGGVTLGKGDTLTLNFNWRNF